MKRFCAAGIGLLLNASSLLGQDALCNAVLDVARQDTATYSYDNVAASLIDHMCEQDFQSSKELENHYSGGSASLGKLGADYSSGGGNESFKENYRSLCESNQESSSSLALLNVVTSFPNSLALEAWNKCIDAGNLPKNVKAVLTPQGNKGTKFTIDLRLTPFKVEKLEVYGITPKNVSCTYAGQSAVGATYPTYEPSLECERPDPAEKISIRVETNIGNSLRMTLDPVDEGSSIITIRAGSFHDPQKGSASAVVLSEIVVLDINNQRLPIAAIQAEGCSATNCMGDVVSLFDDVTDDDGYWATFSKGSQSPAQLRIVLKEPSRVSTVRILQKFAFGCMTECHRKVPEAIRRDLASVLVFLDEEGRGKMFKIGQGAREWIEGRL